MTRNYNIYYKKFINEKNLIAPNSIVRAQFYQIKQYDNIDGEKNKYTERDAPIIFTLFVSKAKDIVHAVKVSNVRPDLVKAFFGNFVNENTSELEIIGDARALYAKFVGKVRYIRQDAYRTYKLSGIKRVLEVDIDTTKLTPKNKPAVNINEKSQVKNK